MKGALGLFFRLICPPCGGAHLCDLLAFLGAQFGGARDGALFTAKLSERDGGGIFPSVIASRSFVDDFAAGDIDHELRQLGGIAGALEQVFWHDRIMHGSPSRFQPRSN